jgi:zinc D-Ala-D-Ala dipeptidase
MKSSYAIFRGFLARLTFITLGVGMLFGNAEAEDLVLITDPRVLAVRVVDNREPMINLKDQQQIAFGPSPEIPNNQDYTLMRKSVYEKLKQAQSLLPPHLHFCLYEGYRSLSLQKFLFEKRYEKVKSQHPDWSSDQIFIESTKLVSPVVNQDGSINIPPHSTGGAIDIYLVDDQGKYVDMGIHPKDWMSDSDGSLSKTASPVISATAQKNRQIMNHALSAVGFVNYPTEYWHWSYGDRYWAYEKKQPHAIYESYAFK